jgi:hypothetical protein
MEKEFVSYEQAVALKELGFDEICLANYWKKIFYCKVTFHQPATIPNSPESCLVPLKQQVFRWFRENYNMLANVYSNASGFLYEYHDTIGGTHRLSSGFNGDCELSGAFTTYEKAENACIDKLIEISKQLNKQ